MNIEQIWSEANEKDLFFRFWQTHLNWLSKLGWKDALKKGTLPDGLGDPQHKTVKYLREFIQETSYVNAHFGLTSSDVEDNVRLRLINDSIHVIAASKSKFLASFTQLFNLCGFSIPAFTHWQPAGTLDGEFKAMQMTKPIEILFTHPPKIRAKALGGPIGDNDDFYRLIHAIGAAESWVSFPWKEFGLGIPLNMSPIQSSDYSSESEFINWCCAIAANLYKLSADLRFYASHGLLEDKKPDGYRGSSSIPKKNNPLRFEKVCSITTSISTAQTEMWQIIATNGCERTLNTSWHIERLLKRVSKDLFYALETFTSDLIIFDLSACKSFSSAKLKQVEREEMTKQIISGKSRVEVYESIHKI